MYVQYVRQACNWDCATSSHNSSICARQTPSCNVPVAL